MNKKIIAVVSIIAIMAVVLSVTSNLALDESRISQTIFVDAVYESKSSIVKITYNDNSENTNLVSLEILGMDQTFHKEFSQSSFKTYLTTCRYMTVEQKYRKASQTAAVYAVIVYVF